METLSEDMKTKEREARGHRLAIRVTEAAEMLAIGRSKCYDLIRCGDLPAIRVGKTVRVPLAALCEWVERQIAEQKKPTISQPERRDNGTKDTR